MAQGLWSSKTAVVSGPVGDEAGFAGAYVVQVESRERGTGVILDEMIRAADDLGYNGQKVGQLAMSRIGEKQGRDLGEQLGVKTMKDAVDVVMLANRFFDIEITLTETKEGEYVINADRCPWFGGMGHDGVPGWDVKPCAAFLHLRESYGPGHKPERKALLHRETHHRRPHLPRRLPVQGQRLGDNVEPQTEFVGLGKKPERNGDAGETVQIGRKAKTPAE